MTIRPGRYDSIEEFLEAADWYLTERFGFSVEDLPDVVFVDDYFYPGCYKDSVIDFLIDALNQSGMPDFAQEVAEDHGR